MICIKLSSLYLGILVLFVGIYPDVSVSAATHHVHIKPELTRKALLNQMINTSATEDPYDPRAPPDYEKDIPTNVTIKIFLLSFDSVSETTMDYSVEIYLTMIWVDERLQFLNYSDFKWLEVGTKLMDAVWVPDVYFRNEKTAAFHDVTVPNRYLHLYPNGTVVYSMRLSLTLICRMDLLKYPLDTQICPMVIQSYVYTTENVLFWWDTHQPLIFDGDLDLNQGLPQFAITDSITVGCTASLGGTNFACIKASFTLRRDVRYYVIQVYIPSILIVGLSWVSFWLDLNAIPARVSLGVLTVLTLNTHGSNVQAALPKVSYIKAIDVWTVACLIFVFSALLEFAYVNVLSRRGDKLNYIGSGCGTTPCFCDIDIDPDKDTSNDNSTPEKRRQNYQKWRHAARRVDKMSRIAFPVGFITFNLVYWITYVFVDI
ncbi:glycine receptor subunit alpha-2 [Patella vulgata]|uniref:glycine receptor subunit alpha-2 n=1 Tax=Patella vulgata TaxID=6465 RepID=UPI00217F71AE|nr:glycine receptor subunit alpha-2 [Patella vulgata]